MSANDSLFDKADIGKFTEEVRRLFLLRLDIAAFAQFYPEHAQRPGVMYGAVVCAPTTSEARMHVGDYCREHVPAMPHSVWYASSGVSNAYYLGLAQHTVPAGIIQVDVSHAVRHQYPLALVGNLRNK